MRRAFSLVALALSAALLSACTGPDGVRAQQLLDQSATAMKDVRSLSFNMRVYTTGAPGGQDISMSLSGGATAAGEFAMRGHIDGVPTGGDFQLVARGGTVYVQAGGQWTSVPAQPGARTGQLQSMLAGFDLTRFVKSVHVDEGLVLDGEPVTKIVGVIDTADLMKGVLSQLGGGLGSTGGLPVGELADSLGDARAVLYLSERTHRLERMLVDLTVKAAGRKIGLHVDVALLKVNEPIVLPGVGAAS